MNHGNSWSLYFNDPEDNTVEIYMDTPWYVAQPFADDLDLDLPDDEIHRVTEARVHAGERCSSADEWSERMNERLKATPIPE